MRTLLHPSEVLPNDQYISVCIPTYCRPFYLQKALDTLAEYADMPYEVIVHDDASPVEDRASLLDLAPKISFTIFNNGTNTGLGDSANRCIALASSKYVLFLNDDCFFVRPCLKDICNVLSRPYIGIISPMNDIGPLADHEAKQVNGTRYAVSNFLGGGSCIAFRKSVWQEVEGFDFRSTSGQADNVFIYKILKTGYWKAVMEGADRVKVGNFVYGNDYVPTAGIMTGDCSYPKIFGINPDLLTRLGHSRREACQYWVDGERTIPNRTTYDNRPNPTAGLNDIPYWHHYFLDVFGGKNSHSVRDINWVTAHRHGQDQWKDDILNDSGLVI